MHKTVILEKNFKNGDLIVTTSGRAGVCSGISRGFGTSKFDHDITFEEAVKIHFENMKREYPDMFKNLTIEQMENILDKNNKYFLNNRGEVQSYENHEVADEFDKLYYKDEIDLSKLCELKDKYVKEFDVPWSKYSEDEIGDFRIFDDITEWINKNLNK